MRVSRSSTLTLVLVSLVSSAAVAARIPIVPDERLPIVETRGIDGRIEVAGAGSAGWTVELYAASPQGATRVAGTVSGADGRFRFPSQPTSGTVAYVLARRAATDRLLAVIGVVGELPKSVVVNERTTIASIWTSAQLLHADGLSGNAVGLVIAARNVPNLVDLATGGPGPVLSSYVNSARSTAFALFNTLASLLSDCLTEGCPAFFGLARAPGGPLPSDTLQAFLAVARNPGRNVVEIFEQRPPADVADPAGYPAFLPTLLWPPTGWTLTLVYTGGGFSAPGEMAIDAQGNVWSNNNFVPGSQSVLLDPKPGAVNVLAYTGIGVTQLRSDGHPLSPPTGFLGGGTFGGAFGMAIDQRGHAWVGNFAGDSLTELAPDGTPLSPDSFPQYGPSGGYRTEPPLDSPQSILFDQRGDLWVTNLMGDTVTQLVAADPAQARTWGPGCADGFKNPWGLASDAQGRIWVTNSGGNKVSLLDPDVTKTAPFCPTASFPLVAPSEPQGLAVDPLGNVWVANTAGGNVQLLEAASGFTPARVLDGDGSTVGPWAIAVDGVGNIWVSDFFGKKLINLCGATGSCPQGLEPGDPISPPGDGGGYGAGGALESITAIDIDQAGNVWVANNFDQNPVCLLGAGAPARGERSTVPLEQLQPRCPGNGAAVTFGIASPVHNPLIGPAHAP